MMYVSINKQLVNYAGFQPSATMVMRFALFWVAASLDFLTLEDGTDTLSRNVGKYLPFDAA
jgi:hypothetical protein